MWTWRASSNRAHHQLDALDEFVEVFGFGVELFAAFWGKAIEAGAAIVFRGAPFGLEPAFDQHAVQRGIERAVFDFEAVARSAFDVFGDGVAVERPASEGFQYEQEERAGKELRTIVVRHRV